MSKKYSYNTEEIGISVEVAIAKVFSVGVDQKYVNRGNSKVVDKLQPKIKDIFNKHSIPYPKSHTAENQNLVDFKLTDGTTLSIKSNQKQMGKVAPQSIGQPTCETYFEYFKKYITFKLPSSENGKRQLFKEISIDYIDIVIQHYWDNLFECDHLLYFYNIIDKNGTPLKDYCCEYISKPKYKPTWDKSKFYFTRSKDNWKEGCTVKYLSNSGKKVSIGEFQAHRNRNCLKFRFNMKGIFKLIESKDI